MNTDAQIREDVRMQTDGRFVMYAMPTELQAKALELLDVRPSVVPRRPPHRAS